VELKGGQVPAIVYSSRTFVASFKADPELWSRFKLECKVRGVSICHVLEALMEAWIQGQRATSTVIKPVVVNLKMQHIVKRPRRMAPHPLDQEAEDLARFIARFGACNRLKPRGTLPGYIGWCSWLKKNIMGHECATCVMSGQTY